VGPNHLKFGGGVAGSVINPLVLLAVLIACALICFAPRQKALVAFLTAGLLIPIDQVLVLGGVHFPMLRILAIAGFIRILRERRPSKTWLFAGGMNGLDVSVILLTFITAINGVILFHEFGAFVYQVGNVCTIMGTYLLSRLLIRSEEDILCAIRTLACIAAFVGLVMSYEITSGHNPYALLGGAHAYAISNLVQRDDRFRAQGPFGHSILAGTCGAVMVPLFAALWWMSRKDRKLAIVGFVGGTIMTVACNSSTPILGWAAGIGALCLWPVRRSMQAVRWAIVALLVVLQIVMKHPVWHLIIDIDITGGSSSWHRYMLVDQCIQHFRDWWLVGVKDTSVWGWDMWDTANQYVATCDNSGLVPFLLFMACLVYGFKYLGRVRRAVERDKRKALFAWGLSSALVANAVAFFGISYWDQTQVVWYAFLAMISGLVASQRRQPAVTPKASETRKLRVPQSGPGELAGVA
jgi:hypothetical protein